MIRVAFGWIGGAGRKPAARSARPERAVGVLRAAVLDLGVDPEVRDPAGRGRGSCGRPLGERHRPRRPSTSRRDRTARRVGEAPRQRPRAADEHLGADLAVGLAGADRAADQPLTALTAAHARELEVRARVAGGDEGVPGSRRPVGLGHDAGAGGGAGRP